MTTLEDLGIDDSALADELIAAAYDNDRRHVFHSWSAQGALKPVVIAGASGSDRKSTRLNSSHSQQSRMPSSA